MVLSCDRGCLPTASCNLAPAAAPTAAAARHLPPPQEALLQLKSQVPGLHLKKSTAAQSPAAPFPITAWADVTAPSAAERYDVQSFRLQLRLGPGVLGGSAAAALDAAGSPTAASGAAAEQLSLPAAVEVAVLSPDLPHRLQAAMAAELHRMWSQSNPGELGCDAGAALHGLWLVAGWACGWTELPLVSLQDSHAHT